MRKIKYKVWDKKEKKMAEVFTISFGKGEVACVHYVDGGGVYLNDKEYELLQFTGLVDKNKKEIYEHDIVQQTSTYIYPNGRKVVRVFNRMIVFVNGAFHISNSKNKASKTPHLHPVPMWKQKIEVIGNIYENPEVSLRGDVSVNHYK